MTENCTEKYQINRLMFRPKSTAVGKIQINNISVNVLCLTFGGMD